MEPIHPHAGWHSLPLARSPRPARLGARTAVLRYGSSSDHLVTRSPVSNCAFPPQNHGLVAESTQVLGPGLISISNQSKDDLWRQPAEDARIVTRRITLPRRSALRAIRHFPSRRNSAAL